MTTAPLEPVPEVAPGEDPGSLPPEEPDQPDVLPPDAPTEPRPGGSRSPGPVRG